MSRIYKMKQDLQDFQDCQDEEENVGERKSLILFIVFIVKILLGIKKFPFMQDEPLILSIV